MNSDFEKRLTQQSLRELPPEWRQEILGTATTAGAPARKEKFFLTIKQHVVSLLWPNPRAWAGLAAVWMAVLFLNFSTDDNRPTTYAKNSPAPDWIGVLREQQRFMAELNRPADRTEIQRPKKVVPSPRSHLRKEEDFYLV